ncbi:hypothetical protein [Sulfuritalea sp.]|uniref:hypothetical protein n=1 Tax=Sulfuritalea sp. TaxID=2480090 RepID=UPI00286E445F|nr:hypothetical protein [Sulfuritalea sp.]
MTTDPATIFTALGGLANLGKAIAEASDASQRKAQLIEFQNAIINANTMIASVQQQNAFLLREKDGLEKQIVQLKHWEAEKQRYRLVTVLDGIAVYAVKESMSQDESPHWLCTNCFNGGKKSFLNTIDGSRGFSMLTCSVCNSKLQTEYRGILRPEYAPG